MPKRKFSATFVVPEHVRNASTKRENSFSTNTLNKNWSKRIFSTTKMSFTVWSKLKGLTIVLCSLRQGNPRFLKSREL